MSNLKLHLDADTSNKALHSTLLSRGHDVTRTPNNWMPLDASDETQLSSSTEQGRCIFTFNIRDFVALSGRFTQHCGIILAAQNSWTLSDLIAALDRALSTMQAESLRGQVRWLNQWKM
jgi:hypothetical protein